ncbi:MAG: hypothetical protein NTY01_02355 [Verrucomicrobia bacterium]|nr:hypothetical protein [Verrucomicrobiota bacterium]
MPIEEWDHLQTRSPLCNGCQRPFADKEDYQTALLLTAEGYRRRDLCQTCWSAAERANAVSYWQGTFRIPLPPKPETLKKEDAESLLRKFIDSKDPGHANARYILAIMLERKRTLKHRDTTEQDGQKILIYEHARTGETFLVPDPRLRLDQLEAVQTEVAALLAPPPALTPVEQALAAAEQEANADAATAPAVENNPSDTDKSHAS